MHNNTPSGWRPLTTKIAIAALVTAAIVAAWPVAAQVFQYEHKWTCGPTLDLGKELQSAGEQIVGTGKIDGVLSMTLWVNTTSRSWTIVATPSAAPDTSCIVVHGAEFRPIVSGPVI